VTIDVYLNMRTRWMRRPEPLHGGAPQSPDLMRRVN
jgi:hypothetical protein